MPESRFPRMKRIVMMAVGLALAGGCGTSAAPAGGARSPAPGASVTLADLGWLLGTWRGTGEGGGEEFFERYSVRDDSTFSIVYFTDSTCTATQPVTGTVEERAGRIYHTYGPSRWVVPEGSPASLLFHPVERANNRFRWTSERATRWTATLMHTDSLGREVARTYTLHRLHAGDTPNAEYQGCAR